MLIFAIKKMLRNKWMILCLALGSVVFVAVLSSIPTYTNGILQRMLVKDLENRQISRKTYPGTYYISYQMKDSNDEIGDRYKRSSELAERIENQYINQIGLPVLAMRRQYALDRFYYFTRVSNTQKRPGVVALSGFEDHVNIIDGRLPSKDADSEALEFVISKTDYAKTDIRLNDPFDLYTYSIPGADKRFGKAVCVGIYEPLENDPYWYTQTWLDSPTFIVDYDYMVKKIVEPESIYIKSMAYYYFLDYSQIRLENVRSMLGAISYQRAELYNQATFTFEMGEVLQSYESRRAFLELMLWILQVPVILMLVFYIFMVSRLMIDYESNEIAVLKSRGTTTMRIFSVYALEGVLLCGIAFIIGPPLGLLICRMLGLSNGFLEFVQRKGLPMHLTSSSYVYAAIALGLFLIVMLIPALAASRETIVNAKRKKGRVSGMPLWQKLCLDFVSLGVSIYALYLYRTRSELMSLSNAGGMDAPIDPTIIIANTLFILGMGLLFLRLFPLLVGLIFRLGHRLWSPSAYSTLLNVSRYRGGNQFLSLFLILTIGLGIWNATAARTLNRFEEDRIRYAGGADIMLQQSWPTERVTFRVRGSGDEATFERGNSSSSSDSGQGEEVLISRLQSVEPPFSVFSKLDGVEEVTKVFTRKADMSAGQANSAITLMGIIPHEFGKIAWMRQDLLPHHINNYLNVMTSDPSAVLLSSALKDKGFKLGDRVKIGWSEQSNTLDCTVYGFVDYWPSINPVPSSAGDTSLFVIANLNLIHRVMRMEPYAVWIKLEEGATSAMVYESLNKNQITVSQIYDTRQNLIAAKNDPMLQGMNGALTLEFIVILGITFIGFLIYWILSIRSRILQFGILRAMGLSRRGIISTLVWEQVVISGSAIAAGVGIGNLASQIYIPTLQLIYSASEQVPPFLVTGNTSDYVTMFSVLGGMLIIGLTVLILMLRGIKVSQVLKLGED